MKKLPYGISNYEKIVEDNYEYVDKTRYIEKMENLAEPNIMFLRPRKFGKTLFTSIQRRARKNITNNERKL